MMMGNIIDTIISNKEREIVSNMLSPYNYKISKF